MKGMRERVEGVGGVLSVESAPGESSTLTVELPVVGLASPSRLERPRVAEEVASTTET